MITKSRTQLQQDKKRFVKRFYYDWKKFSREYAYHPQSSKVEHHIDEYNSSVLIWQSPQVMKDAGRLSENNRLFVELVHPDDAKDQVIFKIRIEMEFNTKRYSAASREFQCVINPALNLHTSVITTKLLVTIASLIRQNNLESAVSIGIISIMNSI